MKKLSVTLRFCVLAIGATALFLSSAHSTQARGDLAQVQEEAVAIDYEAWASDEYYQVREVGFSVYVPEPPKPLFPNEDQLKLIGRLADGIFKLKKRAYPYDCGVRFTDDEQLMENALLWAYNIVKASWAASDEDNELNVWGVAGTLSIESKFDLCSFGLHPRKAAYTTIYKGKPVLKSSKLSVSHTYEDVVKAIYNPKMQKKFRTFDLGGLQVLALYYDGKMERLLTWDGFYWQVNWMMTKQRRHKRKNPWAYWPGRYSVKRHKKVVRHARRLGATPEEIRF